MREFTETGGLPAQHDGAVPIQFPRNVGINFTNSFTNNNYPKFYTSGQKLDSRCYS